jgi:hypothetical protein
MFIHYMLSTLSNRGSCCSNLWNHAVQTFLSTCVRCLPSLLSTWTYQPPLQHSHLCVAA